MNEVYTLDRDFLFKSKIFEITSISVEQNFKVDGSSIYGDFIVSGSYRLHEISINKEDFSFKVPFKHDLPSNINLDTVKLDISDFSYNFNNLDELSVHIEYIVTAEEGVKVFESEEKLDDFLNEQKKQDVDIVDLRSEPVDLPNEIIMPIAKDEKEISTTSTENKQDKIDENMIINSINDKDEYVLYHVHTVGISDSIESITKKYNISVNTLKEYNTFDTLELNMKLIIPNEEL
mgnify:FL=1